MNRAVQSPAGTLIENEELCTVGSDHAVVTWVTPEKKTDTSVYFGEEKTNLTRLVFEKENEFHRAEIKNLKPSTLYWYRVASGGARGPLNSFRTLPVPGGKFLFSFALFSDTHLSLQDGVRDPNEIFFGKLSEHSGELLRQAIFDGWERGVDLAVFAGDLTDSASRLQYVYFRDRILPLFGGTPCFLCAGNHDKYVARSGGGLGEKGFLEYAAGRSKTYAAPVHGEHLFLLLDSCREDRDRGFLDAAQLGWAVETLRKNAGRPAFLFLHHPCNGPDVWFGLKNFRSFQRALRGIPGLRGVFCGHMHRCLVTTGRLAAPDLPFVELPATVQFPCAYAVVRVYEEGWAYNVYKVSRLDLSEKSRGRAIFKSPGGTLYTRYAFGGAGDRSLCWFRGSLHRPAEYELSVTLEHTRAVALYEKAQSLAGASLTPAPGAGKTKVVLGRHATKELAAEAQQELGALAGGGKLLVAEPGGYGTPGEVRRTFEAYLKRRENP
ncbi:MAG: metallophosphoesterase [Desulfotomaculales bacterium]